MLDVPGGPIEYEYRPGAGDRPCLVFLHEGLGSIDLWRGVPAELADTLADDAGDWPMLVFARHGYGASAPAVMPRPASYMHHEADVVLPAVLGELGIEQPVLVGHSDGASIALLYAGAGHRVRGIVCLAPHVFVEPESIAGIAEAKRMFDSSPMAEKMARYHADPVATFRGWNDVWLSDEFRDWDITDRLANISAPVLLIQGTDDQYGTFAQLDAIEAGVAGPVEQLRVEGAGHAPHLDARDAVVAAVARMVGSLV
jgi:pimeloyl-ACP methyl ester carboxylesterase